MTKLAPAVSPKFGTTAASVAEVEELTLVVVMHARVEKLCVHTKAVTSWQLKSSSNRSQAANIAAAVISHAALCHRLSAGRLPSRLRPSCTMLSIILAAFILSGAMLHAAKTSQNALAAAAPASRRRADHLGHTRYAW
eukprot:6703-Heterococcus_DN1.PRE.6